jgi:hypothetical protein
MTNDAIKKIIASVRHQLSALARKDDLGVSERQAVLGRVLGQLAEIEGALK